jgi:hypothetical protein
MALRLLVDDIVAERRALMTASSDECREALDAVLAERANRGGCHRHPGRGSRVCSPI